MAGPVMFGETLAMDLAPYGIRVNAICPGIIDTPLFRSSWEVGHAALYLTSDESSFVTGAALAVDGGRTFH